MGKEEESSACGQPTKGAAREKAGALKGAKEMFTVTSK